MKKYSYLFITGFLCGISCLAKAQSDTVSLALKDALELGLKNRLDIQNQGLQIAIAQNELEKIQSRNLPQVDAVSDLRWNTQRQQNVIQTNQGELRSRFGTPINFSTSIQVNQTIFNPNNQNDRKIAQINQQISEQNLEKSRVDVRLAIAEAYYTVLLQQEKVRLSKENLDRRRIYDEQAEVKFKNANLTLADRERFALDLENAKISLQNDRNTLEINRQNLTNQLGLPVSTFVKVKENLESLLISTPNEVALENNIEKRVEFKQERLQKELNVQNFLAQNKKRLPTVSAYGNFSVQQLAQQFNPGAAGTWSTYNYLGIKAQIPIFDGGLKSSTRKEYELRRQINENNLTKLALDLNYEAESARKEWVKAADNLRLAQKSLKQSQSVLDVDKVRLESANLTYADYRNSEYSLQTAQNNLLEALYNYLLAQIKWQKANAEL